ncbi:28S ribosomal protein S2, mitochondrial [Contarinia nasturtii]|uniref:28S ribosomal protein S2, mitochondrial n=1 Tax=Contarinia nasturtii TaxID=265458 RepID=UPI0012D3F731|nr:28S ribosomal protein S2, mitochondrial [Contarinia nasturtii]
MSKLLTNLFNPTKLQIRTKIIKHRGFTPRTDKAPLQVPENLSEIQAEIKAAKQPENVHLMHPDYFNVHNLFTVTDLFNARIHYGHKDGTLDNRMKPYIFGKRMGHIIFDLDKTALYLRNALNFIAHTAYRDGIILFIGRNPQFTNLIENTAKECGEYAHTRAWRLGVFTNSIGQFHGQIRLPDLCIFLNTLNDVLLPHPGIVEAAKMLIPTVGVVDSNCNPNLITYTIPGNDDSRASVEFFCNMFKQAILRGKQKAQEDAEKSRKISEQNIEKDTMTIIQ